MESGTQLITVRSLGAKLKIAKTRYKRRRFEPLFIISHPEDQINRKHCQQIMDHDPSRNVPHFWRHEHTIFSGFIKARERPHRRRGRRKEKDDGNWRKIIRKPETEPRRARAGGDRLKKERGESRENRHHHHLCSFISKKQKTQKQRGDERTGGGRGERETEREEAENTNQRK